MKMQAQLKSLWNITETTELSHLEAGGRSGLLYSIG